MTTGEIWRAAQTFNTRIQLRDVWFILRQCERRGLVRCFSRREPTGKIYYWTDQGRAVIEAVFGVVVGPVPRGISWWKYSRIARSKVRRLVLLDLAHVRFPHDQMKTAVCVRQSLREAHSVSLNSVIRALHELLQLGLIRINGEGGKRRQKLYRLLPAGRRFAELLVSDLSESERGIEQGDPTTPRTKKESSGVTS